MVKVLIKGAGDLATGVAISFYNIGCHIIMTELKKPTVIRRTVSFANAVYENVSIVENVIAKIATKKNYKNILNKNEIAVIIDPKSNIIKDFKPTVVIDAILAKKNLTTFIKDAPIVIALGPGFRAKKDCHMVIETKRGHDLGTLIENGRAKKNTGIPSKIFDKSIQRILKAPCDGKIILLKKIGDIVMKNEIILKINNIPVHAPFKGCIRGLLKEGLLVKRKMKIGDIDPRTNKKYCYTLSDKSRTIGRATFEAFLKLAKEKKILIFNINKNGEKNE